MGVRLARHNSLSCYLAATSHTPEEWVGASLCPHYRLREQGGQILR
jgi:hypothetical protein